VAVRKIYYSSHHSLPPGHDPGAYPARLPGPAAWPSGLGTFWFRVATFGRAEETALALRASAAMRVAAGKPGGPRHGGHGVRSGHGGHGARVGHESRPVTAGHGQPREALPVTAAAPLEPAARLRRARGRELRCQVRENGRARRSGRKVKCEKNTRRREFEGGTGRPVRVRSRRPGRRPPPRHTWAGGWATKSTLSSACHLKSCQGTYRESYLPAGAGRDVHCCRFKLLPIAALPRA
jgi:hypothetical protein